MDHQAFAQLLGNYGEFFGAIAVVVTLIYLAGQLRQNTKALRAASYDSYANSGTALNDYVARHARDLAGEFGGEQAPEQLIFYSFAQRAFNLMEMTYLHHREGLLDEGVFEARIRGFVSLFRSVEGLQQAWEDSPMFYTDEFRDFMNNRIVQQTL